VDSNQCSQFHPVAAIVTGGLVSTGNPMPQAVLTAHRVTPFLSLIAAAASAYLLGRA